MNKKLIALAVAAGLAAPMAAQAEMKVKWFGFAQITAQKLDQNKSSQKDGITFGADRVRIGFKLKDGNVFGKLQIDFNKPSPGKGSGGNAAQDKTGYNEIIKDALVGYKFSNAAKISFGQFKTPLGMDFNTSGKKLDITKRGMEKKLVLERTQGIMLSGRKIGGGFGYDVFYGNVAARGSAYNSGTNGKDNTTVVRVMYDMGKNLHLEASTGTTENSASGTEDYSVTDFAAKWKGGPAVVKFEYIAGSDTKGDAGADETVWFLHGGFKVAKSTELVARYYLADCDICSATSGSADLSNLYLGVNFFLGSSKTNGRLQLNYVLADGDTIGTTNAFGGTSKGYTDDAILVQYQMSF